MVSSVLDLDELDEQVHIDSLANALSERELLLTGFIAVRG